jgi:hypothetical protein
MGGIEKKTLIGSIVFTVLPPIFPYTSPISEKKRREAVFLMSLEAAFQ